MVITREQLLVGLIPLQHPERVRHHLPGCGDQSLPLSPLGPQSQIELLQTWVTPDGDSRTFDHVPPQELVSELGDVTRQHDVSRLMERRDQPEVGAEMPRVGEAVDVAYRR